MRGAFSVNSCTVKGRGRHGLLERCTNPLYRRGTGYRSQHAALAHDRVAQVGVGCGKFFTHAASIAAQCKQDLAVMRDLTLRALPASDILLALTPSCPID